MIEISRDDYLFRPMSVSDHKVTSRIAFLCFYTSDLVKRVTFVVANDADARYVVRLGSDAPMPAIERELIFNAFRQGLPMTIAVDIES